MKIRTSRSKQHGFSFVEMLIVSAIIGVIAAIAIPMVSRINQSATDAVARRNAQNIASLSSSANAAGAYHIVPESMGGGVAMSIDILSKGIKAELVDIEFLIKLSQDQIDEAANYLSIEALGQEFALVYDAT